MSSTKMGVNIGVNVCERRACFVNVAGAFSPNLGPAAVNVFCDVHDVHSHVHRVNPLKFEQLRESVNIVSNYPGLFKVSRRRFLRSIPRLQEHGNFRSQCSQRSRKGVARR